MCTLLFAMDPPTGPDLYVVSNRDEALDRRAMGPRIHGRRGMRILAPLDVEAGGTWLGLNEVGIFVGITNRFGSDSATDHKSRGHLVFDALGCESVAEAASTIGALSARDYSGFHLLITDGRSGRVVWNDGEAIRKIELASGYYVMSERSFDAAPSPRLHRISDRIIDLGTWSEEHRRRFRQWMVEHDDSDPLEGTCIHAEEANYGTRSSTVVELGSSPQFLHAEGPPCRTAFRDHLDRLASHRK